MANVKFEKSKEINPKLDDMDEIKLKEKELENRHERLVAIPKDIELTKSYYADVIEREKIKLDFLHLWGNDVVSLTPKYKIESSEAWQEVRKRELVLETRMVLKTIEQLEKQLTKSISDLNSQESRCKEDIVRLKKKISDLKELIKVIK